MAWFDSLYIYKAIKGHSSLSGLSIVDTQEGLCGNYCKGSQYKYCYGMQTYCEVSKSIF